nr:MAG TPA: hypothetical protein [Caudoviricetes sp.]
MVDVIHYLTSLFSKLSEACRPSRLSVSRTPSGFSPPASSCERSQSLATSSPLPSVRQNTDNLVNVYIQAKLLSYNALFSIILSMKLSVG